MLAQLREAVPHDVAALPRERIRVRVQPAPAGQPDRAHGAVRRRACRRPDRALSRRVHLHGAHDVDAGCPDRRRALARLLEHRAHRLRRRVDPRVGRARVVRADLARTVRVHVRRQRRAWARDDHRRPVARAPGHRRQAAPRRGEDPRRERQRATDRRDRRDLPARRRDRPEASATSVSRLPTGHPVASGRSATWATSTTTASSTSPTGAAT